MLDEAALKGKPFGVVSQRDKAFFAIAIVAHEDDQLAGWLERPGTVADELAVSPQEI